VQINGEIRWGQTQTDNWNLRQANVLCLAFAEKEKEKEHLSDSLARYVLADVQNR